MPHQILMFRTVQIQTPFEIHSSLSHTMIWVKMRANLSPKRCNNEEDWITYVTIFT